MIKTYIITPEKLQKEVESYQVIMPGVSGEFGILPGHIEFASDLTDGEVRFLNENDEEIDKVKFQSAICEFADDVCRLFAKYVD